jgi:uncharacterized tellurite resistance protein B-like protein
MSDKKELQTIAAAIRKELPVGQQDELFRLAVESGYLAALADGNADAEERTMIAEAITEISDGVVVEWEVEVLLNECNELIGMEGHHGRCAAIGQRLKELGHERTGLMLAALVALATGGLDELEVKMLQRIADAAGVANAQLAEVVKEARGMTSEA